MPETIVVPLDGSPVAEAAPGPAAGPVTTGVVRRSTGPVPARAFHGHG